MCVYHKDLNFHGAQFGMKFETFSRQSSIPSLLFDVVLHFTLVAFMIKYSSIKVIALKTEKFCAQLRRRCFLDFSALTIAKKVRQN